MLCTTSDVALGMRIIALFAVSHRRHLTAMVGNPDSLKTRGVNMSFSERVVIMEWVVRGNTRRSKTFAGELRLMCHREHQVFVDG